MKYNKPNFEFLDYIEYDSSGWLSHKYFIYDLATWLNPSLIVELGTYNGIPLFCSSQAVKDNNLRARLFGVMPAEGTTAVSRVYTRTESPGMFEKVNNELYGKQDISIIRSSCENALSEFDNRTVDILILTRMDKDDQIYRYFEDWTEKVKDEGVVLVNNINKEDENPALSGCWKELKNAYRTMELSHGGGLGIVFRGDKVYDKFIPYQEIWQKYYQTLDDKERLYNQCELKDSEILELENQITQLRLKEYNSINLQLNFLGGTTRLKGLCKDFILGIKLLAREGIKVFIRRIYLYLRGKRVIYDIKQSKNDLQETYIGGRKKTDQQKTQKNSASVCLIVKNEAPYLLEWMAYYLALGFDRIVIYDNESTDNTSEIIKNSKLNDDRIEYIYWQDVKGYSPQLTAYNDVIKWIDTEWIAFFDIDEFLVLKEHDNIHEFLSSFDDNTAAVAINWLVFGSSGYEQYSDDLVIRRFTRCSNPKYLNNRLVKTIARTKNIEHMEIHCAELKAGKYVNASGVPADLLGYVLTPVASHSVAQINHYVLKSREEYHNKIKRGEASYPPNSKERFIKFNDNFWTEHDKNEHSDHSINPMIGPTLKMMDKLGKSS